MRWVPGQVPGDLAPAWRCR